MAGTERLKPTTMFVPVEEWFQRKSNHSQKESRCQTKRSMSPRCGESLPMCALNPQAFHCDLGAMLLPSCYPGSAWNLEARIWFAAPQRRDLRAMKTRPCAPGKINAPPRLTSQNISPAPCRLSLRRSQSFKSTDWKKKKRRNIELGSGFGRFLAAKIEFSYGAGQTVKRQCGDMGGSLRETTPGRRARTD